MADDFPDVMSPVVKVAPGLVGAALSLIFIMYLRIGLYKAKVRSFPQLLPCPVQERSGSPRLCPRHVHLLLIAISRVGRDCPLHGWHQYGMHYLLHAHFVVVVRLWFPSHYLSFCHPSSGVFLNLVPPEVLLADEPNIWNV